MFKVFILIIIVWTQGSPATTTEHHFNSMSSCIEARDHATDIPFMFSRKVKAFCVEK